MSFFLSYFLKKAEGAASFPRIQKGFSYSEYDLLKPPSGLLGDVQVSHYQVTHMATHRGLRTQIQGFLQRQLCHACLEWVQIGILVFNQPSWHIYTMEKQSHPTLVVSVKWHLLGNWSSLMKAATESQRGFRLEGTSGGPLLSLPAQAGPPRATCPRPWVS